MSRTDEDHGGRDDFRLAGPAGMPTVPPRKRWAEPEPAPRRARRGRPERPERPAGWSLADTEYRALRIGLYATLAVSVMVMSGSTESGVSNLGALIAAVALAGLAASATPSGHGRPG